MTDNRTTGVIVALALAVLALMAVTASSANANCSGCYTEEVPPGGGETFSTGGGITLGGGPGEETVYCNKQRDYSNGLGEIHWIPEECHTVGWSYGGYQGTGPACSSPGSELGTIEFTPLRGTTGIINAKQWTVGLELSPGEARFAEFACGEGYRATIRGSVIGVITPINKAVTAEDHFTLAFNGNGTVQEVTKFEGGTKAVLEESLNGGKFTKIALNGTDLMTPSTTMELRAVGLPSSLKGSHPGWGQCKLHVSGNYSDPNCTSKAKPLGTGSYEWSGSSYGIAAKGFSSEGGPAVFAANYRVCLPNEERTPSCGEVSEETIPIEVECANEQAAGELTGRKEVKNVSVHFDECSAFGSVPCENVIGSEGEIQSYKLTGTLGYINRATREVGLDLVPAVKKGRFAEFACDGLFGIVVGSGNLKKEGCVYIETSKCGGDGIIAPITPVNMMTSTYTQTYTINPETDENIPDKFEGKSLQVLESYLYNLEEPRRSSLWSKAGEELTTVTTMEEESEISA
jgi:hypothetical protein